MQTTTTTTATTTTTPADWLPPDDANVTSRSNVTTASDTSADDVGNVTSALCATVDLVFVVDSPPSAQRQDWYVMQSFLAAVVAPLAVGERCLRVAAVRNGSLVFALDAHDDVAGVLRALHRMAWSGDGGGEARAGLAAGLRAARYDALTSRRVARRAARRGARDVIVALASGGWTAERDEANATLDAAREARALDATLLGVLVGDVAPGLDALLREVVSEPAERHLLRIADAADVSDTVERLTRLLLVH